VPFTPYHLGPSAVIGMGAVKLFHLPALLIGSVIVDIEPFTVLVFDLDYPLHGFFHTFLGGTIAALLVAVILYFLRKPIDRFMVRIKLEQKSGFWFILWSAMFGMATHIFLDSIFHLDIHPFYPFARNPFYGLLSRGVVLGLCSVSFLVAVVIYLIRFVCKARQSAA
jgi:membrane-bound metal-dependent hydrolase YbcI (DUF457 family)